MEFKYSGGGVIVLDANDETTFDVIKYSLSNVNVVYSDPRYSFNSKTIIFEYKDTDMPISNFIVKIVAYKSDKFGKFTINYDENVSLNNEVVRKSSYTISSEKTNLKGESMFNNKKLN